MALQWVSPPTPVLIVAMVLWIGCWSIGSSEAQTTPHTVTFDNQSGQNAVVKLMGPTKVVTRVPLGQKRTVHAANGDYHILVRYGNSPKEYTYTKGEPFRVAQHDDQYSIITITLHRIIAGDALPGLVSGEEFESAGVSQK